jgi:hypothetical protein
MIKIALTADKPIRIFLKIFQNMKIFRINKIDNIGDILESVFINVFIVVKRLHFNLFILKTQ